MALTKISMTLCFLIIIADLKTTYGQVSECTLPRCNCCQDQVCTSSDGNCTNGCIDGNWGNTCVNLCPGNCATCEQGNGNGYPCTSCIDGFYWPSSRFDCKYKCRSRCVSCDHYDKCTKCPDGRYGITCRYSCYNGCEGGVCDIMDGKCTCKAGYISGFCPASCLNTPCACCKNNNCETNNGSYCTDGCIDGIWGDMCDKECPSDCLTCTQDSINYGRPCTSCLPGKYSGRWNDYSFEKYHDYCRYDCRDECVSCTSFNNCTECIDGIYGSYGDNCEHYCFDGCEGGVCDKMDGKCTCIAGYSDSACKQCASNEYGQYPNCSSCPEKCITCSSFGSCDICIDGYYNGNNAVTGVTHFNCSHHCRSTCYSCSSYDSCEVCTNGLWGQKCENNCSNGCEGGTCNTTNGKCSCISGYDINTDCSKCVLNKYGSNCDIDCDSNCLNNGEQSKCYGHNGTCVVGCQEGFYGDKCDLRCHQNCEHFNCSRSHGLCFHGCQNGFIVSGSDCVPAMLNENVKDFSVANFSGAIGGAVVFVVIIVVVGILIKRRNNRPQCCWVTTNNVTIGKDDTKHVNVDTKDRANDQFAVTDYTEIHEYLELDDIVGNDPANDQVEVTDYTDIHEYLELDDIVRNDPGDSTTDGYEVPIQHHCETVGDGYEPLKKIRNESGKYDKLVVPVYEDTAISNTSEFVKQIEHL